MVLTGQVLAAHLHNQPTSSPSDFSTHLDLNHSPRRQRHYYLPKRLFVPTILHGVKSLKTFMWSLLWFFTARRYSCSPVTILQFRVTGAPSVGQPRKLVSNTRIWCHCLAASHWYLQHNFVNNRQNFHAVRKYATIVFYLVCCPLTGKSGTKSK